MLRCIHIAQFFSNSHKKGVAVGIHIAHRKGTPPMVGKFFESHIGSVLGLPKPPSEEFGADLHLAGKKLQLIVEVKASDNNHHFRISLPQLSNHLQSGEFPYDGCIYCLIGYRNRDTKKGKKKNRRSLLVRCKTQTDVELFLANHMDSIYIFDALFIEAIGKKQGTFEGVIPFCPGLQTVVIKRTWIKKLLKKPKSVLSGLGLVFNGWKINECKMAIEFSAGLLGRVAPEITVVYAIRNKFLGEIKNTIEKSLLLPANL